MQTYQERTNFLQTKQHGYIRYKQVYLIIAHENIYIIKAPVCFREEKPSTNMPFEKKPEHSNYTLRFAEKTDRFHSKTRNKRCINHKIPFFYRNHIPLVVDAQNSIVATYTEFIFS